MQPHHFFIDLCHIWGTYESTNNGRYAAVNLCNYATIEFRLFRGTLKHNTLIAAIELVKKLGVKKVYVNCLIELEGLGGRMYLEGKSDGLDCLFGIEVDE